MTALVPMHNQAARPGFGSGKFLSDFLEPALEERVVCLAIIMKGCL